MISLKDKSYIIDVERDDYSEEKEVINCEDLKEKSILFKRFIEEERKLTIELNKLTKNKYLIEVLNNIYDTTLEAQKVFYGDWEK